MATMGRILGVLRVGVSATALFLHARTYDLLCDDAYISLRYAKHLASGNGLVYNVGERVEGYTNFLWVVLEAALLKAGAEPRTVVDILGALTAIGAASVIEWGGATVGLGVLARLVSHAALASSVSFAVWLLGGLEASAFGVLVLATLLAAHEAVGANLPQKTRGGVAGLVAAAAMLMRPETPIVVACAALSAAFVYRGAAVAALLRAGAAFTLVVGPMLLARRAYYGDWLPNTFYLKTTGDGVELLTQGVQYLRYAGGHHGVFLAVALAGLVVLVRRAPTRVFALSALGFLVLDVVYIARIGGDFLPATRFIAPLLPLLALLCGVVAEELGGQVPEAMPGARSRVVRGAMATVVLVLVAVPQLVWSRSVAVVHEVEEQQLHIEPLRWTRLYALRWAALGRWISAHAKPGDWMSMGAAGAAPYYAGLTVSNLDILGLCDKYVAHEGDVVGSRPGHQRRAPLAYTLSKEPVFVFDGDFDRDYEPRLKRSPVWEARGYQWARARIDAKQYGAPSTFWYVFLLRNDRALELRGTPGLGLATDELN